MEAQGLLIIWSHRPELPPRIELCMERERKVWKGAVAGLLGGVAASAAMLVFQRLWSVGAERAGRPDVKPGAMFDRDPESEHQRQDDKRPNSSELAAQKLAGSVGVSLGPRSGKFAGLVGHFAYGAAMGAVYGSLSEGAASARRRLASGIAFGMAVFLFDQFFLPAAGLSERPDRVPVSTHAFGAANHVVYGAVTEAVRTAVRSA